MGNTFADLPTVAYILACSLLWRALLLSCEKEEKNASPTLSTKNDVIIGFPGSKVKNVRNEIVVVM